MPNARVRNVSYSTLIAIVGSQIDCYWTARTVGYSVYATIDSPGGGYFLATIITNQEDITAFESNLKIITNEVESADDAEVLGYLNLGNPRVKPKTPDGKESISAWQPETKWTTSITPDWTKRTTWYYNSIRVVDEVATADDAPIYTKYSPSHTNLIDTYHGKISDEDTLLDGDGNSYRVVVKVNNTVKTERDPHVGSGGDYEINYATGQITFFTSLQSTDEVKCTYHYENGSMWILKPLPGKKIKLVKVEAQFSSNFDMTDTILFEVYVGGNLYSTKVYKTMMDFINEAQGAFPTIPVLGGTNWRSTNDIIQVFQWPYIGLREFKSSYAAEIRIRLEHNVAFGGANATATVYYFIEDE